MAAYTLRSLAAGALFAALLVTALPAAELIEPSRTLDGRSETGSVSVYSEPPELPVLVNGTRMGATPVFELRLPAGRHRLRVKDAEIEATVAPGMPLRLRYIDGRIVKLPEGEKAAPPAEAAAAGSRSTVRTEPPSAQVGGITYEPLYFPLNPRGPIY